METPIIKGDLEIHDRKSGNHTVVRGFHDAFADCRDVFARDDTANDFVQKFPALAPLLRLEPQPNMPVLPAAASLADVFTLNLHGLFECFLIRHLRGSDICLDFELAFHTIHDDLEVQLAHTGNDGLASLLIAFDMKSRILFAEFL